MASLKSYSAGDSSSIYEEDCSFIDSESGDEGINLAFGNPVNKTNSDSNLALKFGTTDLSKVKDSSKFRTALSSDSRLYRKSPNLLIRSQRMVREEIESKSQDSMVDDVFVKESESKTVNDATAILSEPKVYYTGDNGNIIVPKICIEGEEMYTTFDEIDTDMKENVEGIDPETYHDKIVAIEIAKEMAKLDRQDQKLKSKTDIQQKSNRSRSEQSLFDKDRTINDKFSSEIGRNVTDTGARMEMKDFQRNGSKLKYSSSLKEKGTISPRGGSPKSGRSMIPGIGGSMSYEQLKSSVPDIRLSFHTEECEVIYINEKDETTKL